MIPISSTNRMGMLQGCDQDFSNWTEAYELFLHRVHLQMSLLRDYIF